MSNQVSGWSEPVMSTCFTLWGSNPSSRSSRKMARVSAEGKTASSAALPAIVNSLSSGCAEMQRMRLYDGSSVRVRRLVRAIEPAVLLPAHVVEGGPRPSERRREVGELAEERPRVARIDDLLDPERLGRAERRAELGQALLDLGHLRLAIRRRVEIRPVRGLDSALERQR